MTTPEFDVIRDPLWDNIRLDESALKASEVAEASRRTAALQAY